MALEFKLPDIGEGIAEGEITRWHVQEGQTVKENDPFVEVMTDKATVEITAPASGKIAAIKFAAGATAPVGAVIAVIETSGGSGAALQKAQAATASAGSATDRPAAPAPKPAVAASGSASASAFASAAAPARAAAPMADGGNGGVAVAAASGERVLAAPAVRRRARELGIDLRQVAGSGPAGRVSGNDLDQFVQSRGAGRSAAPALARPVAPAPVAGGATEERLPLRGIRKRIAERMHKSKATAAHFTYVDELDATNLVELREALKPSAAEKGVKLTYMPFIIQATIAALKKFPMLNATLDDEKQEIVVKNYWHVGFACDTDQGLVVPVIKDADRRTLLNLGAAVQDLTARARESKLSLDEVSGSTFTITNAGNIGGLFATPVINWPEVAILGVHKIADRAVVKNGAIVIRKTMYLSVSIDHRVVDGATGARFMNEVLQLLEDPRRLLLGSL
ncbi:MAG TPA: dihydrolipoamide acetyltransferase family protein [Planctomycetota bacterium]|nr:dihydrolipoamide acetyltransferase family protein [Planctomycetota bacterium]